MNELAEVQTINSVELAEMVSKEHKNVLADIRKHNQNLTDLAKQMEDLGQLNFQPTGYFIEGSYLDGQNKKRSCFHVTKLGCDYYANKMTGTKGAEFTVKYMHRFEEMKRALQTQQTPMLTTESLQKVLLASNQNTIQIISNTFAPAINSIADKVVGLESKLETMKRQNNDLLSKVKLDSRQARHLTKLLLDKLSELHGKKITTRDYQFIAAKDLLFDKYEVRKYEDIPAIEYYAVVADIDTLDDPDNIEF